MHVTLDSRLIKPGDYFVPVVGETTDGHKYIDLALKNGAVGVIEEDELYKIAEKKLQKINPKIVAVTGSVGKSTTKDFILKLLSTKFIVCDGYLNTKLGLATNVVNEMKDDCEIFVAECGMDRKGELLETGKFLNPDIVVLTNISESHMEKLGSIEAIMEAKAELVQTIKPDGLGVFNETNEYVKRVAEKYSPTNKIFYGIKFSSLIEKCYGLDLPTHYKLNLQATYEVAKFLGVSDELLESAIQSIQSPKGRLCKLIGINNSVIFDDTYNASPESTVAALKYVCDFSNNNNFSRKIAILGGMLELGSFEDEGHKKVGDAIIDYQFDVAVLVGDLAQKYLNSSKLISSQIPILKFKDSADAGDKIIPQLNISCSDVILVKGSQGIRMEKVVEKLLKDPSQAPKLLVRQDLRWK